MTGATHVGFAPVFSQKFTNQFRKLKSGDSQMKFIREQANSVILGKTVVHNNLRLKKVCIALSNLLYPLQFSMQDTLYLLI